MKNGSSNGDAYVDEYIGSAFRGVVSTMEGRSFMEVSPQQTSCVVYFPAAGKHLSDSRDNIHFWLQ